MKEKSDAGYLNHSPHNDKYGRVLIYSIPSDIHAATAGEFCK